MSGLNLITQQLFGISLISVAPAEGELWADDVRKLEVVHETEGLLGILYCDLYARPGKNSHPSHYNIRSSRLLDDGTYQTPIMALVCGFDSPNLNFVQLETLFHEAGHALHSVLGRARYQNISGTRCSLDFVELPSTLMEVSVFLRSM